MNLAQTLLDRNTSRAQLVAYTDDQRTITFGQLEREVRQLATWLQQQQLAPDEIVTVAIPNSINTVKAFLAVILAGGIAAMINPQVKQMPITTRLSLTADSFPATDDLPLLTTAYPRHETDGVFMLWTSGTTGFSHPITHNALSACAQSEAVAVKSLKLTEQDRIYTTAKIHFALGMIVNVLHVLWTGASAYLDPGLAIVSRVRKNINTFKPTLFYSVPVIYSQLGVSDEPWPLDMRCHSGGDRLSEQIRNRWFELTGQHIYNSFGTTEGLTSFCMNFQGGGAIGRPVPGYEMRLDHEGRLEVKCPGMDWMFTGDRCSIDEHGMYHHLGRYSDSIKIGTGFVNPVEVEDVLTTHPSIEQAAVVSKSNEQGIEQIEAYLVLMPNQPKPNDLRTWARGRLLRHACPTKFHFVAELPRSDAGKVQRFRLREQLSH